MEAVVTVTNIIQLQIEVAEVKVLVDRMIAVPRPVFQAVKVAVEVQGSDTDGYTSKL